MTTATEQRDGLSSLEAAVSNLLKKWRSGELSPYRVRLEPKARWACFKQLIRERGGRYVGCTPATFAVLSSEHRKALDRVEQFCDAMPDQISGGAGIVFLGPPGTGKDHLMFAAMRRAIIEHGFAVKWADGLRLYATIKGAIASGTTEAVLAEYVKPQILALSDPIPPRDVLSPYELATLRDIIERRYSQSLSTWVTTNVTDRNTAVELFTGAVLDRLLHGAIEVNLCGLDSYRLR